MANPSLSRDAQRSTALCGMFAVFEADAPSDHLRPSTGGRAAHRNGYLHLQHRVRQR